MAKTKISELEKQLGRDRKEIIAFLNEQGIEAKTASSSVDDDAVALVSRHFASGRAVSAPKKPEAAAEQAAKTKKRRSSRRTARQDDEQQDDTVKAEPRSSAKRKESDADDKNGETTEPKRKTRVTARRQRH